MSVSRRSVLRFGTLGIGALLPTTTRAMASMRDAEKRRASNFELVIDFSNLCAYVDRTHEKSMDVLFPDPMRSTNPHPHRPVLVVRGGDLRAFTTRSTFEIPDLAGGWLSVWDLAGFHLEVEDSAAGSLTVHREPTVRSDQDVPASDDEWRDFHWLPDLTRILGDEARLNPRCLSDNPKEASVNARVRLTQGTVEAIPPSDLEMRGIVWRFDRHAGLRAYEQVFADGVRYRRAQDDREVVLSLKPFDDGPTQKIVLQAAAGPQISASVAHWPARAAAGNYHPGHEPSHFGAFYTLLEGPPAGEPLPHFARQLDARTTTRTTDVSPSCMGATLPWPWGPR